MEWIVQLGFELEIYQSNEMAGTYWYTYSRRSVQKFIHLAKLIDGQVPSIPGKHKTSPLGENKDVYQTLSCALTYADC